MRKMALQLQIIRIAMGCYMLHNCPRTRFLSNYSGLNYSLKWPNIIRYSKWVMRLAIRIVILLYYGTLHPAESFPSAWRTRASHLTPAIQYFNSILVPMHLSNLLPAMARIFTMGPLLRSHSHHIYLFRNQLWHSGFRLPTLYPHQLLIVVL